MIVGYPGFFGSLSGMNELGVGALVDRGNFDGEISSLFGNKVPICYSIRQAIEYADCNGDGETNIKDVISAVQCSTVLSSYLIHLISAYPENDTPTAVYEIGNDTCAVRLPEDDTTIVSPWVLAVTNHARKVMEPDTCWRWDVYEDSLNTDWHMSRDRGERLETAVQQWLPELNAGTVQTLVFEPNNLVIYVRISNCDTNAVYMPRVRYAFADYFTGLDVDEQEKHRPKSLKCTVSPNPFNSSCAITAYDPDSAPEGAEIEIYDLRGDVVVTGLAPAHDERAFIWTPDKSIASGIYLVRARTGDGQTASKRIVLLK
jgi:hypothetical protein